MSDESSPLRLDDDRAARTGLKRTTDPAGAVHESNVGTSICQLPDQVGLTVTVQIADTNDFDGAARTGLESATDQAGAVHQTDVGAAIRELPDQVGLAIAVEVTDTNDFDGAARTGLESATDEAGAVHQTDVGAAVGELPDQVGFAVTVEVFLDGLRNGSGTVSDIYRRGRAGVHHCALRRRIVGSNADRRRWRSDRVCAGGHGAEIEPGTSHHGIRDAEAIRPGDTQRYSGAGRKPAQLDAKRPHLARE